MIAERRLEARVASTKPRDAASIILLDRSGSTLRVLMGRRHSAHVFMPDVYVFPGGRRDRNDRLLPFGSDLHPLVFAKLLTLTPPRTTAQSARALALTAVRELAEETSLVFGGNGPMPSDGVDLGCLRYVARAITPPGHVRRYDTRFFCTFADEAGIEPADIRDSDELLDLQWVDTNDADSLNMPDITRTILNDLLVIMKSDPSLGFDIPAPFYFVRNGRSVRTML